MAQITHDIRRIPYLPDIASNKETYKELYTTLPTSNTATTQNASSRYTKHIENNHNTILFISDIFFLGTNNSISYIDPQNESRKLTDNIHIQLHLGIRFFDFALATINKDVWAVSGEAAVRISELFFCFKIYIEEFLKNPLIRSDPVDKIILNFRELVTHTSCIAPTWDWLAERMLENDNNNNNNNNNNFNCFVDYLIPNTFSQQPVIRMEGFIIIFASLDLNLALGDRETVNWGPDYYDIITPRFNGKPTGVFDWLNEQEQGASAFKKKTKNDFIWLNMFDVNIQSCNSNIEYDTLLRSTMAYPQPNCRFNVLTFGDIDSNRICTYRKKYFSTLFEPKKD